MNNGGIVTSVELFDSHSGYDDYYTDIRPVVEIDLSKATIGRTGDGSLNYPYSIEAQ